MTRIKSAGALLVAAVFSATVQAAPCGPHSSNPEAILNNERPWENAGCDKAGLEDMSQARGSVDSEVDAVLTGSSPQLSSGAAMIINQQTGKTLYAKNATAQMPIASITKLMTAIVTLDAGLPLDEQITVSREDVDYLRNTYSRLALGTTLTRAQLLHLALMSSENRAASALGRSYPGGLPAFVRAMNRKAQQLGMTRTRFVDSSGLHAENVSTAADLVKMVNAGYKYNLIREMTTSVSYEVPYKRRTLPYRNSNVLVKNKDWNIGLSKTGFLNEAGRCLVMQAQIARQPIIIVLLDSMSKYARIGDANKIKRWIESSQPAKNRYS